MDVKDINKNDCRKPENKSKYICSHGVTINDMKLNDPRRGIKLLIHAVNWYNRFIITAPEVMLPKRRKDILMSGAIVPKIFGMKKNGNGSKKTFNKSLESIFFYFCCLN